MAGVMFKIGKKYLPISLEWGHLGGAAVCCLIVSLLNDNLNLDGLLAWVVPLILIALVPVILWHSGFFTRSERVQIQASLHGIKWVGSLR